MSELQGLIDFYTEFKDEVLQEYLKLGEWDTPFLYKMLSYIDEEAEVTASPWYKESHKIKINGYEYDEGENTLNLYIVHYSHSQSIDEFQRVSMTELTDAARKVKRFIDRSFTGELHQAIDPSHPAHGLAKLVYQYKSFKQINIYIVTNMIYESNKTIELTFRHVEDTNIIVWDIDRVYQTVSAEQGIKQLHIDFEKDYGETLEMIFVPDPIKEDVKDHFDCYVGYVPALLLAKAYDQYGPQLVERNVRSFLQARAGTNKGIRKTLEDNEQRQKFVAYNNGISGVANSAEVERIHENHNLYRIKTLTGWQIVNGGQTTASIHQAYKKGIDLTDVHVQTKLTILQFDHLDERDRHEQEDEMVANISKFANTQNKINESDLEANSRLFVELERLSRLTWIPSKDERKSETKWYFERARGQYLVDIGRRKKGKEQNNFKKQYPKNHVITKTDLAKHFASWEKLPHVASKGGETAFKKYVELNREVTVDDDYYKKTIARTILFRHIYDIVDNQGLQGYRANVVYYTSAMVNYLYGDKIDLLEVWERQELNNLFDPVINQIAKAAREFLISSAGDRNVTQWAKQEACWKQFHEDYAVALSSLVY
jgi:hypothetical protein